MTTWIRKEVLESLGVKFLEKINSTLITSDGTKFDASLDPAKNPNYPVLEENPIKILQDDEDEEC